MLNAVVVSTANYELLSLPLDDYSGGFIVRNIEGLDPVKATLVSSSFAQVDGEYYQSSRRETRPIKITLELKPDYFTLNVADLRRQLYHFLMPKNQVTLRFYMSGRDPVEIEGRVESFESVLFSKTPTVDISIVCFNPDFKDQVPVTVTGQSSTTSAGAVPYLYNGSVDTGGIFRLFVSEALPQFTIYHTGADGLPHSFDFTAPLQGADMLEINSNVGEKAVTLVRGNNRTSLLYGMTPQSQWITIQPGANTIRLYIPGAINPHLFSLQYTARYGGL